MKDEVLELLKEEFPDIDFESSDNLVEAGVLDSITITGIIAALTMEYDIEIPYEEIVEDNFCSVEALANMVERLRG